VYPSCQVGMCVVWGMRAYKSQLYLKQTRTEKYVMEFQILLAMLSLKVLIASSSSVLLLTHPAGSRQVVAEAKGGGM
jgi:hypothetical protein